MGHCYSYFHHPLSVWDNLDVQQPQRSFSPLPSHTIFDTHSRFTYTTLATCPLPLLSHIPLSLPFPPISQPITSNSLNTTQHIIRPRAKPRIQRPTIAGIRLPRIDADTVLIRAEAEAAFARGAFFERGALFEGVGGGGHGESGGGGEGEEEGGEELHIFGGCCCFIGAWWRKLKGAVKILGFGGSELEIWIGGWGIGRMMLLMRGTREGRKRGVL